MIERFEVPSTVGAVMSYLAFTALAAALFLAAFFGAFYLSRSGWDVLPIVALIGVVVGGPGYILFRTWRRFESGEKPRYAGALAQCILFACFAWFTISLSYVTPSATWSDRASEFSAAIALLVFGWRTFVSVRLAVRNTAVGRSL